jgi:hypothetical protein
MLDYQFSVLTDHPHPFVLLFHRYDLMDVIKKIVFIRIIGR